MSDLIEPQDNPTPPVEPGSPEYDDAMVRKYAETNPAIIPPEFNGDPDKFVQSYRELRKAYTQTSQELSQLRKQPPAEKEEAAPPPPDSELQIKPDQLPPASDFDWAALATEIKTTGDLSAEMRQAAMDAFNVPAEIVDGYVKGYKAQAREVADEAAKTVGGQENLDKIFKWASKLPAEEVEELNRVLASPGWRVALKGLQAQYRDSVTGSPESSRIETTAGGIPISNASTPFDNQTQMMSAIRDPRYEVDPRYTQLVQDKLRAGSVRRRSREA